MRYRTLDADLDMTFGQGRANFLVDTPATVAQAVLTRLMLLRGEWFLDVTAGMPWSTDVLGANTGQRYDQAIREQILDTEGVISIVLYSSTKVARSLQVAVTVATRYGQEILNAVL